VLENTVSGEVLWQVLCIVQCDNIRLFEACTDIQFYDSLLKEQGLAVNHENLQGAYSISL